jgi:hypothetical protein
MDGLAGSVSVAAVVMLLENHAAKGMELVRGQGHDLLARRDGCCGHVPHRTTDPFHCLPESFTACNFHQFDVKVACLK